MRVLLLSLGEYNANGGVNTYIDILRGNMVEIDFYLHSFSNVSILTSEEYEWAALFKQKLMERFAASCPAAFINLEVMKFVHKLMLRKMDLEQFDLVHSQNGLTSFVLKELYPHKPLVGTIHGSFYNESILEGWVNDVNEAKIFTRYDDFALSSPDSIITVTNNIHVPQQYLANHYTIYNGVNLNYFHPEYTVKKPIKIVASGRLTRLKGYDILLDALMKLKSHHDQFKVSICGDGPERIRLETMAHEYQLPVQFCGHLSRAVLATELAEADIFVQPSRAENFPFSVLEAMASGCVPIVSDVGGMTEQIEHAVSGFIFESENAIQLSEIIKELLVNSKLLVDLKMNARSRVETLFSIDKMIADTELVYRKTLKNYRE